MDAKNLQALFNQGVGMHRAGNLAGAEQIYLRLLQFPPPNPMVQQMLGVLRSQQGRNTEALALLEAVVKALPQIPDGWVNYGNVLRGLGRPGDALKAFDKALALGPVRPDMIYNRSAALLEMGRMPEALAGFDRVLALDANFVEAWSNRGYILSQLGRLEDALASYDRALRLRRDADTLNKRAITLWQMGRDAEGLASVEEALSIAPGFVDGWCNRANALRLMKQLEEALASCDRALALAPDYAPALDNRGIVLWEMHRFDEARASYDRALALAPDRGDFYNNRAVLLRDMGRLAEALADVDRAVQLAPGFAEAHFHRANILQDLKRHDEAFEAYEITRKLDPRHPFALGSIAWMALNLCDWDRAAAIAPELKSDRGAIVSPLVLLGYDSDAALQLDATRRFLARHTPAAMPLAGGPYGHDRIRLVYVSVDFNRHPVAYQIAELIEKHDRTRFEVIGISIGADDGSDIRARLKNAFDGFHDLGALDDRTIAARIRALEADILIDLSGHTASSRVSVLAHRPAPVQVSYLGYPATMAAPFMDYILADPVVLPMDQQPFYAERIVHLPHSYWVGVQVRELPPPPSRGDAGLPEQGFVFCAFNNHWKTGAVLFDIWMRLLSAVPGSVLWLKEANEPLRVRLRREAQKRGVDPARLIFAPPIDSNGDHIARQGLADLFLDTIPYNAHATASDALWAGLPLVTCAGKSFSGRVAASFLTALGLEELITENLEDYEALALNLARDPERLAALRARLQQNRLTAPLFNSDASRKAIEAAFLRMHERRARGERPEPFALAE